MNGADVLSVLMAKGIDSLHHANSVTTSLAFLRLGGLASRQRVEAVRFPQTAQYTDALDRNCGIWNDVFTDSVDIHARVRDRNKYGPVLFVLDARTLLALPPGIEVWVTKSNPSKWSGGQAVEDCYFMNAKELRTGLTKGTFDQIVTFRVADGLLPFGAHLRQIVLDDPQMRQANGKDSFAVARDALQDAARAGRFATPVTRRECEMDCKCRPRYAANAELVVKHFSVR